MKKYFMKGTDDEVREGDVIEVVLMGEEDGVTKHSHLEIKFRPEYAKDLLEEDIIEEREVEDEEEDLIEFDDDFREAVSQDLDELDEKVASLEKRVTKLEEDYKLIREIVKGMNKTGYEFTQFLKETVKDIKKEVAEKKTVQPKKK